MKDPERLYFPAEITDEVGLPKNTINRLKRQGCKFFGKKTKIRWVNEFLETASAKPASAEPAEAVPYRSSRR